MLRSLFLLLSFLPSLVFSSPAGISDLPLAYQGRFRSVDAYAKLWVYERAQKLSLEDELTPLELLWGLEMRGPDEYKDCPLFAINNAEMKGFLGLDKKASRFSFNELDKAFKTPERDKLLRLIAARSFYESYTSPGLSEGASKQELSALSPGLWVVLEDSKLSVLANTSSGPWSGFKRGAVLSEDILSMNSRRAQMHTQNGRELLQDLQDFESLGLSSEQSMKNRALQLEKRGSTAQEIAQTLESEFPLVQRLSSASSLFHLLPGKGGKWFPVKALKCEIYSSSSGSFMPVGNFTIYDDEKFARIRSSYLGLQKGENSLIFVSELLNGYSSIAGKAALSAEGKAFYYPSLMQLQAESFYMRVPLTLYCIGLYLLSLALVLFAPRRKRLAFFSLIAAFIFHSGILALRCFILNRAPVSNMFETVIYVPWITVLMGLILRQRLVQVAAAISAILLLALLQITQMDQGLENVQAVLDSQYWLIIHVLMVVGSYGIFILSGMLGHIYLLKAKFAPDQAEDLKILARSILHTLYVGTALLITGTILGGVWAAESWGRFWDWDPKESWAFISSCTYLIAIHLYTFRLIADRGLANASIIGMLVISFTWYGVNYILGTGLHSYGFGSGGENMYLSFLALEVLFLLALGSNKLKEKKL
jgi:ABC-type transport system involved in cytochrome c biogenesis permease subunit